MRTHVVVNNVDLTPHIVEDSYDIQCEDTYESWNDGNAVEHRVVIAQKVKGSFQILCSERGQNITLADFLSTWNGAVNNKVVTIGVYVPVLNQFKALQCYFTLGSPRHIKTSNDDFVDIIKVTITER